MNNKETNPHLIELPIFKHFAEDKITSSLISSWRKGEKGLFWFLQGATAAIAGTLVWKYVLPPIFVGLGQMIGLATTGVLLTGLAISLPFIGKGIRAFTRFIHKMVIKHDPFAELEAQHQKMIDNQEDFRKAKAKILNLKSDMENEASKSEQEATDLQNKILNLHSKAEEIKTKLDKMIEDKGEAIKGEDEYVYANAELIKILSESQRISNKLTQAKDFVKKYGSRAAIMKKFSHKLTMVETSLDIKVLDLSATIEILKKDYEFAQKSKEATESAKSALGFTTEWELEYALDVVTTTIANDVSATSSNLQDINMLTSQYSFDNDELYANLNVLADSIKIGENVVPDAKLYSTDGYELTTEDSLKSGGLDNIF